jgi:hypothetical protein
MAAHGTHRCPGPHCTRIVPDAMLMCRHHWYQVPPELRDAVWGAYDHGRGVGTAGLLRAQTAAIASLDA